VRELLRQAGGLDVLGVKVDHVAGREGRCGRAAAVVVSRHIILRLRQRRLGFFEGVFHPVRELVNCLDVGRRLMWFEAHPQVPAGIEEEGCLLRGGVDVVVVGKLRQGEECVPVVLPFFDEEPQVLFQFLVDPFRLSVDAHSQVIAAEYDRLLRGVRGASTGEVCSNIQSRRSVVK